ncbi:ABC transporter ATP-binding protein [Arcobacter sp. CECT 8983]|uniref:ABC transporter ATP-binding protein n=1 Tax=Arcobacter sp. CECT 8983 TaxID=2044508 RepID=UPI00100AC95D|nr:ABC transporter ATP-binding protein [Arcobacter sp. CECT 8983]RXJ88732.1 ABC transporter ATP-binding protein [Arcobacter sp. CECT 8983]
MQKTIIKIENLTHKYSEKIIYENLNLSINEGSVYGILGKNGVGKSTLINILMGYIKPLKGSCTLFNESSHNLSSQTKKKIALLHEGFIAYDFMTIKQNEEFYSSFYETWDKNIFYELIDLMNLSYEQKISTLSFGQKSQVVLGGLFAQNAKLLILDDYSMGLDAGYRRLFIDYLKDYIKEKKITVLITSHVMEDLVDLIDDMAIVQKGGKVYQDKMSNFIDNFRCYEFHNEKIDKSLIHRIEEFKGKKKIYSFEKFENLKEVQTSFEDKFLGFVGKY